MNVYLVTIEKDNGGQAQFEFGDHDEVLAHLKAVALFEKQCPGQKVKTVKVDFLGTDKEMLDKYNKYN